MKISLVVNRKSGTADAAAIEAELQRHGSSVACFDISDCTASLAGGSDRLVVAGGDGSIGIAADTAANHGVPLAVIPAGTANDFARIAGLPEGMQAAAELAATGVRTRPIDLCYIDDRPFVNVAGAGLSFHAARTAHGWKRMLGALAYPMAAAHAAFKAPSMRCTVDADGERWFDGHAWQVLAANTGAFGGGATIDTADEADAALDLTVIGGSRPALARRAYALLRGGLSRQAEVANRRAYHAVVDSHGAGYNVDGEQLHWDHPVSVRVAPSAFSLVVPD